MRRILPSAKWGSRPDGSLLADTKVEGAKTPMGTLNAFYVRAAREDVAATSTLQRLFPGAAVEASKAFLGVRVADDAFEPPTTKLAEISAQLDTEVIWLAFQSVVDAFHFRHWRGGTEVRALVYGCFEEERTWDLAEGQAEPWESEVLFGRRQLELALLDVTDADERRDLQRIWQEQDIQPGSTEPGIGARECAFEVARHFGLPHYDVHFEPSE